MNWLLLSPWSIRLVALAGLVLLLVLVLRDRRERGRDQLGLGVPRFLLRLAVIGLLVAIALNPTALRPAADPGTPRLGVLLDTSYSMGTPDVAGGPRLTRAVAGLEQALPDLRRDFDLDLRGFDETTRALATTELGGLSATGEASDLAGAVTAMVGDLAEAESQGGLVLLSDGRATTGQLAEAARLALARGVPVWACPLGGEVPRRDCRLSVPASEVLAFGGAEVTLGAVLHQVGYDDRAFAVHLCRDDQVIERLEARPGPTGTARITATVTAPEAGEVRYTFRVPPQPDEAETANNARDLYVRSVGAKVRVLLVEGEPHWDTKFLVQNLKRNPRIDLTAIYRLAEGQQFAVLSRGGEASRDTADHFPRTSADFAAYDIVILGRSCEVFFTEDTERLLTDFVAEQGGSLVFNRGKSYGGRFPALAKLEPVVWGAAQVVARPRLTEAGRDHPLFNLVPGRKADEVLDSLPPFDRIRVSLGAKPLAVVLSRADVGGPPEEAPIVIAWQLYGQGRVLALNAGGIWRWAFHERGDTQREGIYPAFWTNLLRWLLAGSDFLAGHDVALTSDRRLYTDAQPVRLLIRARGLDPESYQPRLHIAGPDTEEILEPRASQGSSFLAEVGPFPPGNYTVTLENNQGRPATLTQELRVVSSSIEKRELSADSAALAELAGTSDGAVLAPDDLSGLSERVRRWRADRQLAEDQIALWDRIWILALLLGILGFEWFLRRRGGLI